MKLSSYDYALFLLSRTPKTVKMMKTTLLFKWYPFEEVQQSLERLIQSDYLNDEAFCEAYIRSEVINKGKSLNLIKKKLYEKGMPQDIVDETIILLQEEFEESTMTNLARDIRKLSQQWHDILKIYEKLSRKWHRYEDIKQALEYINSSEKKH